MKSRPRYRRRRLPCSVGTAALASGADRPWRLEAFEADGRTVFVGLLSNDVALVVDSANALEGVPGSQRQVNALDATMWTWEEEGWRRLPRFLSLASPGKALTSCEQFPAPAAWRES